MYCKIALIALISMAFVITADAQRVRFSSGRRVSGHCSDQHQSCRKWAVKGQCYENGAYMSIYCQKSCELCNDIDPLCQDHHRQCGAWAQKGDCIKNKDFMENTCAKTCSVCLPAKDHSVPHIHTRIARKYWNRGHISANLLDFL